MVQSKERQEADLTGWTFLFEFGRGLFVYGKGAQRVGVNEQGKTVVQYRMDARSKDNPRCKECLKQ